MHPQQPLSYLERLIQAELPYLEKDNKEKFPTVNFSAIDFGDEGQASQKQRAKEEEEFDPSNYALLKETKVKESDGQDDPAYPRFVRWSKSTEIGDFIQDAARGKEFAVELEGAPRSIRVAVPGFKERSYYLR